LEHYFQPTTYHAAIGSHQPVLHVGDGDSIVTTTVDAHGFGQVGKSVTNGPNPQTGPFYVEAAQPGDTLQVTLDSISPNRDHGFTRQAIALNVLDPGHPRHDLDPGLARWCIDLASSTSTIDIPGSQMGPMTVNLRPMLGCFGVAPDTGQSISCATSGQHGGNMDYNGFVTGVKVYFPVFVEGALLHIGDGHAWQGDGEILGTGIEVSMDVKITVQLHKGKKINWPRGENDQYIFTVGNARPLDQAMQHATSEMLHWLQSDFQIDERGAHFLLGTCVEYDLGNFFDPAYTMVCKLPKRVLPNA